MSLPAAPPDVQISQEPKRLSPYRLFTMFMRIALLGFGSILPSTYRILVEREKVVSSADFREMFAFGQILPGPPICNVVVIVGYRNAGVAGSIAALAGLFTLPFVIVILLGLAYQRFGDLEPVRHALAGMSAVAAGLVAATALKMALDLPRQWKNMIFAGLMFAGVAVLRWPLLTVLVVLIPLALLAFRKALRR